ncbi:MAG: anti-sigma factor family protein [Bdellovibrio bacteriovorus]
MRNERPNPEIEDLHAYVDGQLGPEARRRVEEQVSLDPAARRRVEDYVAIREGLRTLYEPVVREPIPLRLLTPPRPRGWIRPLGAMAASLALLVGGAYIGVQLERNQLTPLAGPPSVVREAAMAYAIYTPEVHHPVEVAAGQGEHLVAWLSKRMGTTITAPRLESLGFELVGGRLLASADGPGALLMYEDAEGQRLVLYACHSDTRGRDTAFRYAEDEGISVFHWSDAPLTYALAAELARPDLLAVAQAVYQQTAI